MSQHDYAPPAFRILRVPACRECLAYFAGLACRDTSKDRPSGRGDNPGAALCPAYFNDAPCTFIRRQTLSIELLEQRLILGREPDSLARKRSANARAASQDFVQLGIGEVALPGHACSLLPEPPVAMLELLPRAAWTDLVAADLAPG